MSPDPPVPIDRFAAQSGAARRPGARALRTRRRILDTTIDLLNEVSFRELSTTLVAQRAGLSPPAVYRYFADITEVLAECATTMRGAVDDLVAVVDAEPWQGEAAMASAHRVIEAFRGFWDRHRALYRVIELLADEGDPRFAAARRTTFAALADALTEVVRSGPASAHAGKDERDPAVVAGVLTATLIHVTAHEPGFAANGTDPATLQRHLAEHVATVLTCPPPNATTSAPAAPPGRASRGSAGR